MHNECFESFRDTLEEFMELNGFANVERFADTSGIPRPSLDGWLKGTNRPSLGSAVRTADFCRYSLDYMFGLRDENAFIESRERTNFYERFVLLAKNSGLTDYAISKHCKISSGTIAKWRYHGNLPQIPKLISLAELFGCSLDYLAGRSDNL